ncbi:MULTISPECIES: hypothetical protein [unclassified Barnesiella]|uniref:hypothetical protein n=1 Tax=unclassified Barnesiella TaxID=2645177 RepID=UPI000B39A445|nr:MULTISPECIES: hypothetical protein [unclassified Barnesiella]MCR8910448.1 hypothetical protein [Barnesiella sp. ET7]OUO98606.1 hypothetical protein B5F38_04520 [Barnesiella sp. An22]HJB73770.1 hypothetical protein [Candidatus Barnesiella merdigallinarum]
MFFNEKGILNIDEMVANNDSFKRIMEDNTVDENEIKEQSDKVVAMLHQMEKEFSEEQLLKVKELLVETSVLYAIYNYYSIQHLNQ